MRNMTLQAIANACGGTYYGSSEDAGRIVSGVTIDSRKMSAGCLFIATVGERVDGHSFAREVYERGALCCVVERVLEKSVAGSHPYIVVQSSFQALKDIAAYYRQQLTLKVVGITGSVGKTSTKETIASVLSQRYKVCKTQGNFNNEVGLPLTVLGISDDIEVAVLEMGISNFGEMSRLTRIARPDICVITNIGTCHLENLGDRDGVLKAKTEIFEGMSDDGLVVLNGDDDKLRSIDAVYGQKPFFFGIENKVASYASDIADFGLAGTDCMLHIDGCEDTFAVHIPVPGRHMVYNALAGAVTGFRLGLSPDEIARGLAKLEAISGRNRIITTSGYTIIDDCYNANPMSMRASIDVLKTAAGRKVCILGDMFELGAEENSLHYAVGAYAAQQQIDVLIAVGKLSGETARGAQEAGMSEVHYFSGKKNLFLTLDNLLKAGDTILVKASHGMEFPEIVEYLTK